MSQAANDVTAVRTAIAAHRDAGTCYLCTKPVQAGEARHGTTGAHWDCSKKLANTAKADDAMLQQLLPARQTPRKREGAGAVALRAKALAIAALEELLGGPVTEVSLWNQQGAHRGPRWDLDAWGVHFTYDLDGHAFQGTASSLATMTQCVKWRKLGASAAGNTFTFDLHQPRIPGGGDSP